MRRRVVRYALTGALFGFFIFPWVHVLASALGRRLHPVASTVIYALSHVGWIAVLPLIYISVEFVWDYTLGTDTGYVAPRASIGSALVVSGLCVAVAAANVFSIYLSARFVADRYRADGPGEVGVPGLGYLIPSVGGYVWLRLSFLMAVGIAFYMVSIGVDIQGF